MMDARNKKRRLSCNDMDAEVTSTFTASGGGDDDDQWDNMPEDEEESTGAGSSNANRPGFSALPVGSLPAGFNGVPLDGYQYLAMVSADAATLPDFFTSQHNPYAIVEPLSDVARGKLPEPTSGGWRQSKDSVPSDAWRTSFLAKFSRMRAEVATLPLVPSQDVAELPSSDDAREWFFFIHGHSQGMEMTLAASQEASVQDAAIAQMLEEEQEVLGLPSMSRSLGAPPALGVNAIQPTNALLQRLGEENILVLLAHLTRWIKNRPPASGPSGDSPAVIATLYSRWAFAALAHLDHQLSSDDISTLRNLARASIDAVRLGRKRRAAKAQAELNGTQAEEPPEEPQMDQDPRPPDIAVESGAWIIIAAVVGVWRQSDLWEDAKSVLRNSVMMSV